MKTKQIYGKDIARTIRGNLRRFFAIAIITTLGVAMFSGLEAACEDLRRSGDRFFDAQKLFDLQVMSTLGLSEEDVEVLSEAEGVEEAEGVWQETADVRVGDSTGSVTLRALSDRFNLPYLLSGRMPEKADEAVVTQKFLDDNDAAVGDVFVVRAPEDDEADGTEDETGENGESEEDAETELEFGNSESALRHMKFRIVGAVTDALEVNNTASGAVSYRSAATNRDTIYLLPEASDNELYAVIYLRVAGAAEEYCYEDTYTSRVADIKTYIEDEIMEDREAARYTEVTSEALEKIKEAESDAREELADAREELEEGRQTLKEELEEAESELQDGEKQLEDGRRQLEEGESTLTQKEQEASGQLASARQQLASQRQQLENADAELKQKEAEALPQLKEAEEKIAAGRTELEEQEKEVRAKISSGRKEIVSGRAQIEAGSAEIDAALEQIVAGRAEAEAGLKQIAAGRAEAEAGLEQIRTGRAEAEAGAAQISAGLEQAEAALQQLQETAAQIPAPVQQPPAHDGQTSASGEQSADPGTQSAVPGSQYAAADEQMAAAIAAAQQQIEQLEAQRAEVEQQIAQLDAQQTGLEQQIAQLDAQQTEVEQQIAQLTEQETALTAQKEELTAQLASLEEKQTELDAQEKTAEEQFTAARAEIDSQENTLKEQKEALQTARKQIDEGFALLQQGEAAFAGQAAYGQQQIDAARTELEENRQKLEDSEEELAEGWAEYEKGKREGEEELAEGWEEYRKGEKDAQEKLADARAKVEEIDMADWYVQDRTSLGGYANIGSDADSIEAIATVFPIVFFVVAILISLTTIARMVEEDRGLIGTYKALGFTDREIRQKYLIYTGAAAGTGSLIGSLAAFLLLPWFIFTIFSTMYLLPEYRYSFIPGYGVTGVVLFAGGVMAAAWMACRKELQHMPAALMRPRAPKPGMRVFLEKIPALWKRMSFLNKITARNLFRYKGRMLMTIAGIAGCTALLMFGFAINDSVHDLMPRQYEQTVHYDIMAVAEPGEMQVLEDELKGEMIASYTEAVITSVVLKNEDGRELDAQLIAVPAGDDLAAYVTTETTAGEERILRDGEVFVTQNAGNVLRMTAGDSFRAQLPDLERADLTITALVKNYLGNYVYMTSKTYEEMFGPYEANAALACFRENYPEQTAFCDTLGEKEEILTCVSRQDLLKNFDTSFALISMVVYVVIVMSAALAFVVLFTLATTNISERERELATIKVLGFYDREVHMYIDKETVILTVIGIAAGIPVGYAFAQTLTAILNLPSIYLAVSLHPVSYVISAALSLGFSLIVNIITDRTLNRINPVEALKSVE